MTDGLKARHRTAIIATLAANDRVERAVLFGSRAMGTNTITSDVDIALFGTHLTLTDQARLAAACEELPMAQSVDLLLHSTVDNPALVAHIRTHGVEWYRRGGGRVGATQSNGLYPSADEGKVASSLYHPFFPKHWTHQPLYSMAYWVNGLAFKNIKFTPNGKPIIKISEIKNGISGQTKFTQSEFDESVRIRAGDLLFSWSGQPESSINAFWWRGPEGWLNQHIFRVTPSNEINENFFFYILRYLRPNFIAIARNKQTTGLGHVTKKDLQRIVAAAPPLPEQKAIGHILGTLDDKVELNRRMNETLEAMARALFKDWFVDFGPVRAKAEGRAAYLPEEIWGLFPDSFEGSELGEIPRGWGVEEVGKVVDCVGGSTPSTQEPDYWDGGDNFWVTPKDLSSLAEPFLLDTAKKITRAGVERISSGVLPVGTVLISSRAPVGYVAVAKVRVSINQGFIALKPTDLLPTEYLLNWSLVNVQQFKDRASGTTFAEISKKEFRPIPIHIPSQELLKAFAFHSVSLYEKIVSNIKEMTILTSMRDTLLPKLLAGEVRVGGIEKVVEVMT